MRLHRSLSEVSLESATHFFNLAATQIRRTLIDLARRCSGPEGMGANHHSDGAGGQGSGLRAAVERAEDELTGPETLPEWSAFHEAVSQLPDEQRQVFELRWYSGLSHAEAQKLLELAERTYFRRFHGARVALHGMLQTEWQARRAAA